MGIRLITKKVTGADIQEMLQVLETYIKVAVDLEKEILAGGGIMHADCEAVLIEDGSSQKNIWGANWDPAAKEIVYESLINIRPRDNNRGIEIQDPGIKKKVKKIVEDLLLL